MKALSGPGSALRISLCLSQLFLLAGVPVLHGKDAQGTLKGSIVDTFEHARITRAYVLIHRSGREDRMVAVDSQGRFSVALQPGFYDVFVASLGFDPTCKKVEIGSGKTAEYNVELRMSKLENMPD